MTNDYGYPEIGITFFCLDFLISLMDSLHKDDIVQETLQDHSRTLFERDQEVTREAMKYLCLHFSNEKWE